MSTTDTKTTSEVEEAPELLSVKETAELLRMPTPTVYFLLQNGKLPGFRISGRWKIRRSVLERTILNTPDTKSAILSSLIIDSDRETQDIVSKVLGNAKFANQISFFGADGMNATEGARFDIVFMELNQPDMPGDTLYKMLMKRMPDARIVVMTDTPESEMLGNIMQTGPTWVLKKPVDPSYVNQIVEQVRQQP